LDPDGEAFRVYLIHFLNYYAKSNIVGFDAVYVHLADNYYSTGLATWTDEELLAKIMKNAETLRPLLLGKTAPDLLLYDRENKPVRLHSIDAPYTVVLFWDPDCGHCKKSMPAVHDFYHAYHDRGVEVLAVCTSLGAKAEKCWETVEERDMDHWINVYDPYLRSRFKQIYDIRTTPQVYVLDRDKKILMKKIAPEKLPEIFDHFLNSDG
jgi:peroxiredoxin